MIWTVLSYQLNVPSMTASYREDKKLHQLTIISPSASLVKHAISPKTHLPLQLPDMQKTVPRILSYTSASMFSRHLFHILVV
jgi:hypothetical protein